MIAKQGELHDWHFAHVSGQERPECYVGAVNLLRRLALTHLASGSITLPLYATPHPLVGRAPVMWTDSFAGPVQIAGEALQGAADSPPDATVLLERSGVAAIYVTVAGEAESLRGSGPALVATVPMPEGAVFRTEDDVMGFIRGHLHLRWLHLPDIHGYLAKAQEEAEAEMLRLRQAFERAEQQRAREAGRRWFAIRQGAASGGSRLREEAPSPAAAPAPAPTRPPIAQRTPRPWCPGLAGRGSIQLRKMRDGSQWVYYPAGEYWRIAPAPVPFEGWDEYFPPSVAVVDGDRSLRVVSEGRLFAWFGRDSIFTLIDSDPQVFVHHLPPGD